MTITIVTGVIVIMSLVACFLLPSPFMELAFVINMLSNGVMLGTALSK